MVLLFIHVSQSKSGDNKTIVRILLDSKISLKVWKGAFLALDVAATSNGVLYLISHRINVPAYSCFS